MQVRPIANGIRLAHQGVEVAVYVFTEAEAASARLMPVVTAADTGKKLLCPMPGLVISIAVSEGQEVKAGETLAVVEAMKMQNVLRAERDGTVKKIHAAAGATLAVDALILEFVYHRHSGRMRSGEPGISRFSDVNCTIVRCELHRALARTGGIVTERRQGIIDGLPKTPRETACDPVGIVLRSPWLWSMTRPRSASPRISASRSACSAVRWPRSRCSAIPISR